MVFIDTETNGFPRMVLSIVVPKGFEAFVIKRSFTCIFQGHSRWYAALMQVLLLEYSFQLLQGTGMSFSPLLHFRSVQCSNRNDVQITIPPFDAVYQKAHRRNIQLKGLLITNPSNPLGAAMDTTTLRKLLAFVSTKNIHVVRS